MGKPYPCPGCQGCCPPEDCGDGTKQDINQLTFVVDDVTNDLYIWKLSDWFGDGFLRWSYVLLPNLTNANGSYIVPKNEDCTWPDFVVFDLFTMDGGERVYDHVASGCPSTFMDLAVVQTPVQVVVYPATREVEIQIGSPVAYSFKLSPTAAILNCEETLIEGDTGGPEDGSGNPCFPDAYDLSKQNQIVHGSVTPSV